MSGMPRGGLLVGADSVADVVGRGLGAAEGVIEGDGEVHGAAVEEGEIVDGVMGGGGGEGEEMLCIVLAWLLSGHFA
jgi:hypothetical protein